MKSFTHPIPRRLWLRVNLPVVLLTSLLQRTPVLRVIAVVEDMAIASPAGALLRAGAAALASLGALHSLAGATVLVATQPSPVAATTTSNVQLGFTVTNTINIASWRISGSVPPGLTFSALEGGGTLTGPGTLQAPAGPAMDDGYGGTIAPMVTTTPLLRGTPTQSGTYTFQLQAFADPSLGLPGSNTFPFTINVAGAAPANTPPVFTTQPAPQSVTVGASISLSAAASGTPAPTYQWQRDSAAIAGATDATLALTNVQSSDAGTYTVVATNSAGNATSTAVTLAVNNPTGGGTAPAIARQPVAQTVAIGSTVVFNSDVTGSPSPAFQWRKNGAAIGGATSGSLVIRATAADAGSYSLIATNAGGAATSAVVDLTVTNDPNFGHLINLSIRTSISAGDPFFTVGTVVGGPGTTGTKSMLVRAVGPSLAAFGITGALADSKVDIVAGGSVVAANDNWNGDAALSNAFSQVGAFPFAAVSSKDAAVFNGAFPARDYTVQVSGVGGATGEVLAELYDATPAGAFGATTPRLVNVSVRKKIDTDGSLTAGFVVGGNTARTVLVRAIGPGLAAFGLQGTMPDPQLALFNGSQTQIAENDNWGGDPQLTATGSAIGAFAIANAASKDAMLLITLAPGNYTAQVKGSSGGGDTLVEVYEVP